MTNEQIEDLAKAEYPHDPLLHNNRIQKAIRNAEIAGFIKGFKARDEFDGLTNDDINALYEYFRIHDKTIFEHRMFAFFSRLKNTPKQ